MILDRLQVLSAIIFIAPAIPKNVETGKNCLFIRLEDNNLILTGGSEFVVKKVVLTRPITTVEASKEDLLPKSFMVPRADIMAFAEMMKGHKEGCKKLAKNDPSHLFVEVDENKLISYDAKIIYEQPKFEFKNLEPLFNIIKGPVYGVPMMPGDISSAVFGFQKSEEIKTSFSGERSPVHFEQGDYEAVLFPPAEKKAEEDGDKQIEFNEE